MKNRTKTQQADAAVAETLATDAPASNQAAPQSVPAKRKQGRLPKLLVEPGLIEEGWGLACVRTAEGLCPRPPAKASGIANRLVGRLNGESTIHHVEDTPDDRASCDRHAPSRSWPSP